MCGRFTITKEKDEVIEFLNNHFQIKELNDIDLPKYNIGPGQDLLSVIYDGNHYRAGFIPWDYKTSYKGEFKQVINARSETIDQLFSFKNAFKNKRCLILADGFYEWDQQTKQPYRITKKDNHLYFYAGIYERFNKNDKNTFGALIITTEANELINKHHQRMPVILDVEKAKNYLSQDLSIDELKMLLEPYPEKLMSLYPVSKDVNHMKNDSIELIKKTTII